jgi:hypothetical protein
MMDIFTTQLVRVVPVPIKPASLKVKALLKEAGTSKLKEDPEHLENHDYYFVDEHSNNDTDKENKQESKLAKQEIDMTDEQSDDTEPKEKVKHLDLYV